MTRAWTILMTSVLGHYDEKGIGHCDDRGYGALW